MTKKKLLHIQLLPLLSGVQNMMLSLLSGLDKQEYEIYVISKPGGPLEEAVHQAGYHYLPVRTLQRNISFCDLAAFVEIYRLIRKYNFDIVHTHSSKTGFIGRIAARMAGVPKVYHTVHGFAIHEHQPNTINLVFMLLEYLAGKFCDQVIFVNNYEREMAIKKRILPERKVKTIYNGILVGEFQVKKAEAYLSERDYESNPFTIGSVLRFTAQKNTLNTISAAIAVCQESDIIRFVFIGDGDDFLICKKLVEKENLNTRILLTGWQSEINILLAKMDVFLLYSRWEGLSISILEAMATGLPIVASDIKGNRELVNNENGILVDVNHKEELIAALVKLPYAKEQLKIWSIASRIKAQEKFNIEKFIREYKAIYDS